ncbi:ABC transporter, ATP-binding protein [Cyanobium sp. PCC 7001]|uniref:ABC transporter ATP-binding protein n=1 Tax=Cyanobium sp. PCC 7001 TaxID=180281 RepID=UPI000180508A|nr:ABC transporter ATP-binding protein [Cyanobium sp. PCC 7001]EDY38421.1 ABC transporter, ATP-binding protein [Cyanobium sp. PCC 7001]
MGDSDVVIRAEGLGKKYALHHEANQGYTALRDVLARKARAAGALLNPFTLAGQLRMGRRKAAQTRTEGDEEFWALKDVSFEIRHGERVGIVGRNGAGKSTLLKILSRITEPTTGRVEICGRVASLLEVGTGFHPELTGRENIYLNGAILGMTRREIRAKFEEIVDFAEVQKFLDTPVKRYSSGMYVRLAFAVAAHLEPEILVVDEVLAVGDAGFQKKCLGKMEDVADREGRTVLLVSHQLSSIQRLCNKGIFLRDGIIACQGSSEEAVSAYMDSSSHSSHSIYNVLTSINRSGSGEARFEDAYFVEADTGKRTNSLAGGKPYSFRMLIRNNTLTTLRDVVVSYAITDMIGSCILLFRSTFEAITFDLGPGHTMIDSAIEVLPLAPSAYSIVLFCSHRDSQVLDSISDAVQLSVDNCVFFDSGSPGLPSHCKVLVKTTWSSYSSTNSGKC